MATALALKQRSYVPGWFTAVAKKLSSAVSNLFRWAFPQAKVLSHRERRQQRKAMVREALKSK